MKPDEIVKELRRRGLSNGASLGKHMGICDIAADCIESLHAQLATEAELHHRYEKLALKNAMAYDEACDKLAESQRERDAAVEDIPTAVHHHQGCCSICKHAVWDDEMEKWLCTTFAKWPRRDCFEWCGPDAGEGVEE